MNDDERGGDVDRRIDRWEELRDSLGRDAPHSMVGFLNAEMDRMRLNKLGADRERAADEAEAKSPKNHD
ncbi:hypothetical protein ACFOMD_06410 [Sphingoaurantiacus capsulatus]|uniref:Uncharacterized protein n=1 Tax=Sphingoaurantiacus capsulatus TaxID=1771310 RepID=A0ABV7XAY3_9SPHN